MGGTHAGMRAVVTGAASGIGKATARRLVIEGAAVGVLDVDGSRAEEAVREITEEGGRAVAVAADVRDRPTVRAALAEVAAGLGGLDYLVNNAGIVTMTSFEETTDEDWDSVMDINARGAYVVTQEALPYLRESGPGAAVVNLSTIEAEVVVSSGGSAQVHYNASKGAVKMLTKALAVELSRYGIRVNAVAPGPIATGFAPGVDFDDPGVRGFMDQRLLVKRPGRPEDVAAAISFLLSSDAAYITGVQLPVDGGWLVR